MSLPSLLTLEVIEALENFMERKRPAERFRDKHDLSCRIENNSVNIFELLPHWNKTDEPAARKIAKAAYIKTKNKWNAAWKKPDLKRLNSKRNPTVDTISDFLKVMDEHRKFRFR